jgi:hypothetical protein
VLGFGRLERLVTANLTDRRSDLRGQLSQARAQASVRIAGFAIASSNWNGTRDADFWIENASVEWDEAEAPFHVVARLTLLRSSQLSSEASDAIYFDVTGNASPDSTPVGSINRARCPAEVASRKARTNAARQKIQ